MESGPDFSKALTIVVKAPDSEQACFVGMWLNENNQYAYLEPLAIIPKYRKMSLGKLALVEGMKKTKVLGATYCFGGSNEFYTRIRLETKVQRELCNLRITFISYHS